MLAFVDSNNTVTPWWGQEVNGFWHPINVETLWSDAELNASGLYRVQQFAAPAGQQITGEPTYTITNNVAIQTFQTIPLPQAAPSAAPTGSGATVITE